MTIEEKVRKEKRAKILEDIRKPIILTPALREAGMKKKNGSNVSSKEGHHHPQARKNDEDVTDSNSIILGESDSRR